MQCKKTFGNHDISHIFSRFCTHAAPLEIICHVKAISVHCSLTFMLSVKKYRSYCICTSVQAKGEEHTPLDHTGHTPPIGLACALHCLECYLRFQLNMGSFHLVVVKTFLNTQEKMLLKKLFV